MTTWSQPPPCEAAPDTRLSMFASVTAAGAYALVANQLAGGSVSAYVGPVTDSPPAVRPFP